MKKKVKKYADGGLASIAENAQALMNDVDGLANKINYGSETATGSIQSFGANPLGFKKGGKVLSASKRADGIAQRGKTKGRFV